MEKIITEKKYKNINIEIFNDKIIIKPHFNFLERLFIGIGFLIKGKLIFTNPKVEMNIKNKSEINLNLGEKKNENQGTD